MKKVLALVLASILTLSMAGCGKDTIESQGTGVIDESGNVVAGTTIDGAGKEVNINAVEGDKLTSVKGEIDSSATIGNYGVSVEDAKVIDYNGEKNIVVTFNFKNKSSDNVAFDNVMVVEAKQGSSELLGNVVQGVEGINILSAVELIGKGDKTTAQKVYKLSDDETPVDITVYQYGNSTGTVISKTFNLK